MEEISNIDGIPPHKQLSKKRVDIISPEISCFHINTDNDVNYKKHIRDNWEYYAYHSDIWKKRISEFGGYIENTKIEFRCENEMERFYSQYGLELDEQPMYVQDMGFSHCTNDAFDWKYWHKSVFHCVPNIILEDNYKYNW